MKKLPLRLLFVLAGIFFLSVLIRIPNLNRPLSKHHEFCTAHVLRILEVWDEDGIKNFHFAPVMNYQNNGDAGINNQASTTGLMHDESGNFYYVSHPPLAYYLPFISFKIFHVHPTALALQIFNLIFHFITAVFIFLITSVIVNRTVILSEAKNPNQIGGFFATLRLAQNDGWWTGIIAFTVYCFTPATLWFHSNVYMSDMFVQVFFAWSIYLFLKFFILRDRHNSRQLAWFALSVFLMCYTTWFGFFVAAGFILFSVFMGKLKIKKWNEIILLSGSSAVLALCLMLFQFGSINGERALLKELTVRFTERDSINHNLFLSIKSLIINYCTSYFPFLVFAAVGYWYLRFSKKICPVFDKTQIHFLILCILPIVLLHLLLLNYSGHDFTTLYAAVPLAVICALLFNKLSTVLKPRFILSMGISVLFIGLMQYFVINPPGKHSVMGDRYDFYQKQGNFISSESSPEEMVFLLHQKPETQLIYYAKRNIRFIDSIPQAYTFLGKSLVRKGVVFSCDEDCSEYKVEERIGIQ